ncbi:MAG: 3'-5' exonuclease, partial [Ruthenibacterium sp.]
MHDHDDKNLGARFLALRKRYIEAQFGRLNEMQQTAVYATDGPLLILAGAGSGKTTVLVNRVANLVRFGGAHNAAAAPGGVTQEDCAELEALLQSKEAPSAQLAPKLAENPVRPYNIFAITFTNKAAGELKNRLMAMLGDVAGGDINASTFHSACVRMLRRNADRLGFPQSFTIYDSDDQQRTMKEIYKELGVDDKFLPVKNALGSIGRLKDKMISPEQALAATADSRAGLVARVYDAYAKRLKKAGAFDFDDLIYYTVCMLEQFEDVRTYYQNRFKYILVDEYQDTSVAQYRLVYLLGSGHRNVCVVGDDDQSIYRFRGATIENILNFEQQFTGAQVIRLEQNYRSTSNILNAANCVIRNNQGRKGKTLWTKNGDGDHVMHYAAESEFDEAAHVATIIGQNLRQGAKLRDHAILYRMNAQSGPIETYFARAGIPYKIVGGRRFYDRKEIRDVLAYMAIVANRQDDLRLRRVINEPARKIGLTTLDSVASLAAQNGVAMLDIVAEAVTYPPLARAASALAGFYDIYLRLCTSHDTQPLDVFVAEIIAITGYRKMIEAEGEEGQTRLENIGQLVSSVKTYADQRGPEASLAGFLEEVALISDIDGYDESADLVVLMTMHAAKGLEFDYVFIVGMEESMFPSDMSRYSEDDLEEERRLCYVGITRAKKTLYLSNAASRMLFGQTKRNRPSRFLEEIDATLMEEEVSPAAEQMKKARERYAAQQNAYVQQGYTSRPTTAAGAVGTASPRPSIMAGGFGGAGSAI